MTEQTISSLAVLEKKARLSRDPNKARKRALEHYFSRGGIIRVDLASKKPGAWPRLVYPTKLRLRALIRQKDSLKSNYSKKKKNWEKKLREAELYGVKHALKKFSSPLYWKHWVKVLRDPDYRADAERVKLPMRLVADQRWQPMIRMFIEDLEYRKQLTETVQHSIVYKKDKKLARYATELQDFRKSESTRKLKELDKKLSEIEADINSYRELIKWANE